MAHNQNIVNHSEPFAGWNALPPAALMPPTNFRAVPDDSETLLHWEADFKNVDYYEIRVNGVFIYSNVQMGALLDTNVTNGQAYSYEIRAVKGATSSNWSASVNVQSAGKITATGTYYYVDRTNGSDANNGLSTGTAFATINHALSVVNAGDGIRILSGTYQETAATGGKQTLPITLTPITSGTEADKIIIEAAPGHEGAVIIDGQGTHYGVFMTDYSANSISHYVFRGLRFQNTRGASIGHWDLVARSAGVIVEDCDFDVVRAADGSNVAHIAFWGSEDWVMRNNKVDDASEDTAGRGNGFQSYEMQRAVIYHNTFLNNLAAGVLLKNFYTVPYHAADIFLNLFQSQDNGLRVQIAGAGTPAAGFVGCNNNIFDSQSLYGIAYFMEEADVYSNELRVFNNSFYNIDKAINVSGCESLKVGGNLTPSCNTDLQLRNAFGNNIVKLQASDYNVFDSSLGIAANRYGTPQDIFTDLASWQAVQAGDNPTLEVTAPDVNSIQSTAAALYTDAANGDFTNASGSPAIGLMADGSNAGAYQTGTEQIGAA